MKINNSVVFKGNKNGIDVFLDNNIPYDKLKKSFTKKVLSARSFFGNSQTSISFKGRMLSDTEENEFLKIISRETGLDISFVKKDIEHKDIEYKDIISVDSIKKNNDLENTKKKKKLDPKENLTYYHKGSIRSGQSINFEGSVVIFGDVNPGGEIIAEGNIIVLGSLKGFVHAGVQNNMDCFISAYLMKPTQLRIGNVISYIPEEEFRTNKKIEPSIAFIEDGQIYIEIM